MIHTLNHYYPLNNVFISGSARSYSLAKKKPHFIRTKKVNNTRLRNNIFVQNILYYIIVYCHKYYIYLKRSYKAFYLTPTMEFKDVYLLDYNYIMIIERFIIIFNL